MRYFVLIFFLCVLLAPFVAPYDPLVSHLTDALRLPGSPFLLGTDGNGRDILSQILYGARLSLVISITVVGVCVVTGTVIGFAAGYCGGMFERLFLLVSDVFQAFPGILLAIALAAFLRPTVANLILLLSFVGWVSYARLVRAKVMEMRDQEFVLAGEALGVSKRRLLMRYFVPNMAGPLVVQASFGMAGVILAESSLSFLGLGTPLHAPSLGKLLDSGVNLLLIAPHVSLFPGLVIMVFVLFFNKVGDRLRERLAG